MCLYENGWAYTWYHGWAKVGKTLKDYGMRHLHYREVRRKSGVANEFMPTQFVRPPASCESHTLALFAMYNPDGRVSDSVWLYLNGLREIVDEIVVCSDSAVCAEDVERMKSIVSCGIFARHGEYDFGSLRRAYLVVEEKGYLRGCGMLVMANDSCVGPIFPLSGMMASMANRRCDFWGQTSYSFHGHPHVQSYFTVFSEKVVASGVLGDFFRSLPVCQTRAEVVSSCEIGLTEFLVKKGFSWDSYVPYRAVLKNPTCSPRLLVTKYACPLVKVKALLGETFEPLEEARNAVKWANPRVYDAFLEMSPGWEPMPQGVGA